MPIQQHYFHVPQKDQTIQITHFALNAPEQIQMNSFERKCSGIRHKLFARLRRGSLFHIFIYEENLYRATRGNYSQALSTPA